MVIEKTKNNPPSTRVDVNGNGDVSNSALELESPTHIDMKKMSQSELYTLSLSSSSAFDLSDTENVVVPNINSNHHFTPTTTTSPTKIFAFSHRRRRPHHTASENDVVAEPELEENKLILNSLEKLVAESDANNDGGIRKRKRKSKVLEENNVGDELGVINVNGEEIDLRFLVGVGDGEFGGELNRRTEGMVTEDEFLGFLAGLEGRWGSKRERRKYVDAEIFVKKALPANWKILLSLRPRARQPSLYCRRFVSPSNEHFKSCKDVAFYLKSQFVTNDANPPDEGALMPIENDHQAGPESVAIVPISSVAVEEVNLLETSELRNVPVTSVIEFNARRLEVDDLTRKRSISNDVFCILESNPLPVIRQTNVSSSVVEDSLKHKSVVVKEEVDPLPDKIISPSGEGSSSMNGEGSSSMPESSNEPKQNSEVRINLKTRCMWCLDDFTRAPVDAETLASSSGFMCPKCKEEISGRLETTLSKFYRHADK